MSTAVPVLGFVAPGFEKVRAAFERNFHERHELGAAVSIYHRGVPVVDLWGGYRDLQKSSPWTEETIVCVFSTSKGMAAMAVAVAHSQGLLQLDALVSDYWPEFASAGKGQTTVRQLLAHQAGLAAIDTPLTPEELASAETLSTIIARQRPAWVPGTKHGYHTLTLGWLESQLIRRADPQRRSLGQFFQDEIADRLGLDFHFGVSPSIADGRMAEIEDVTPWQLAKSFYVLPWRFLLSMANPRSLARRSLTNPRLRRPADICRHEYQQLEIPAGNGIGTVRSIGKAYGVFAMGGGDLDLQPHTFTALTSPRAPSQGRRDQVLGVKTSYSCGFMQPFRGFRFSPSQRAFGTPGLGGSVGFADPDHQLGFAYAPNRAGCYLWNDPRERAIRNACYECLR